MTAIEYLKKSDYRLAKVIDAIGDIDYSSYNRCTDSFVFLVREIVGQMISANVKHIIYNRLLCICSGNINPTSISKLTINELRGIGLSQSKSRFIKGLAEVVIQQPTIFSDLQNKSDLEVISDLKKIDGIGNWTAKMYLIFFLQRENVIPFEDGAFLQAYRWLYNTKMTKPSDIVKRCHKWEPYSSIGARYLYKALDNGLTKIPIKEFLNQ